METRHPLGDRPLCGGEATGGLWPIADVRAVYCCGPHCASKPPFVSPQGAHRVPGSRSSAYESASDFGLSVDNSTPPTGRDTAWQSASTTRVRLRVQERRRWSTTSRDESAEGSRHRLPSCPDHSTAHNALAVVQAKTCTGGRRRADDNHGNFAQERTTCPQWGTVQKTKGSDHQAVASAPRSGF